MDRQLAEKHIVAALARLEELSRTTEHDADIIAEMRAAATTQFNMAFALIQHFDHAATNHPSDRLN